jgi:hypothetical protein
VATWAHQSSRLTDAEADRFDRWGEVCGASPKCQQPATTWISYRYVTGSARRTTTARKRACDGHASAFAAKHGITIEPAATTEPARGIIGDAAAAWMLGPADAVSIRPTGRHWVTTCYSRNGAVTSGTCWLKDLPSGIAVADVLPHAEAALAAQYRLVPTSTWQIDGDNARACVALAEDSDAWRDARWAVTVYEDPPRYHGEKAVWTAVATLGPQFKDVSWPLGNTGMDLDRAIRTTAAEMADAWELGEWTRHDNATAATTAYRKQVPCAA